MAHVCTSGRLGTRCYVKCFHGSPLASIVMTLCIVSVTILAGCPTNTGIVGTNVCLQCHNGTLAPDRSEFTENPHNDVGCEACHGPGLLHVRNGGRGGLYIDSLEDMNYSTSVQFCAKCHGKQAEDYLKSGHALSESVTCLDCHDVHGENVMVASPEDNSLCLQCHGPFGFSNEAEISAHTFHSVNPETTGASRCVLCHLPPLDRVQQGDGPNSHTLQPIPPIESNIAAENGVTPVPPNSCSGIAGCHDGTVPNAPVFNVDNPEHNDLLQILFDIRYGD